MPDFPTWVQDALASGQIKERELEGWTPLGRYLFHHALGNSAQVRIEWASDKTNLAWVGGYSKDADIWQFAILRPFPEALRIANNLIAALESQPSPEVERLQKRVDMLEDELADAERVINNTRLMAAERMRQVMAEMAHLRVQVKELSDPIVRAKMMEPPGPTIVQALSPTLTTGYVGDGAPIQKTDAFGVVEDETL